MIDKFLSIMFLAAPLFYITRMSLRKAETIFFVMSLAVLFILSYFQTSKRSFKSTPFIVLVILALVQLVIYDFSPTTSGCFTNILLGVMGVFIIAQHSDGLNQSMMRMVVIAGIINIVVVIMQNFGYSPIIITNHNQYGGFMGNSPRLGDFLALTFPIAFCYSWLAGLLWLLTGLYIHQFPMFMVAAVFFFCGQYKASQDGLKASWGWLVLILLILFIGWQYAHIFQSVRIRIDQWLPIIDQIFQHPIFGLGVGTYQLFSNSYDEVCMSSLVEFYFNFGLVAGSVILFLFIRDFFNTLKFTVIQMTIIGLAALSIVEYPFEIQRLWPYLIAIGGFYLIEKPRGA